MLNDYSTFRDKPTPFSSTSALASTAALVPQELWDLILDRLDSYADLSTAARVCRAWNARAVQRLYHTLVFRAPTNIDDDHPQPTPTHLDGLVRAKSAVLPYIRHVEIHDDSSALPPYGAQMFDLDVGASDKSFALSHLLTLSYALGSIPSTSNHLRALTLSGGSSSGWLVLGPTVLGAVRKWTWARGVVDLVMPLPASNDFLRGVHRVRALDVDWRFDLAQFSEFLSYLTLLTHLTIRGPVQEQKGEEVKAPQFESPCEVHVVSEHAAAVLQWATLAPERIQGLNVVSVGLSRHLLLRRGKGGEGDGVVEGMVKSLAVVAPRFDGSDADDFATLCAGLSRFANLEQLTLYAPPPTSAPVSSSPASPAFHAAFRDFTVPPTLSVLTLALKPRYERGRLVLLCDAHLAALDAALADSPFGRANDVRFVIVGGGEAGLDVAERMPRLAVRGNVCVRNAPYDLNGTR